MKQKIHILINEEARRLGLFYGFWNWFFIFQKDLLDLNIKVNFFSSMNDKFLDADHLFLNSRSFPEINNRVDTNLLKKLCLKNKNLYWFDMRDSAGTTQFEVLPFVKKYIKKQFYKDKKIYFKKLRGGRFYSDHYIKKYNLKDFEEYDQKLLDNLHLSKLILGWNLGVAFFFDYINFTKLDYFSELIKFKFLNRKNFKMKLPFYQNWNDDKYKNDFISLMNTNFYRTSVGGYGWGEVCYREFEAIMCGAAFMTADMSNIETWPNIYHDGETYLSYDLDFKKLNHNLETLIKDINLRKKLVNNSRDILKDCHSSIGKDYFLKKIQEIIN